MGLKSYLVRHCNIEQNQPVTDSAGGWTDLWTSLGAAPARMATLGAKDRDVYERDGFTLVRRLQFEDRLPRRVSGYTSLYDLLTASTIANIRFVFNGRQLWPIRVNKTNNGDVGPDVVNVDCTDNIRPTGFDNLASGS